MVANCIFDKVKKKYVTRCTRRKKVGRQRKTQFVSCGCCTKQQTGKTKSFCAYMDPVCKGEFSCPNGKFADAKVCYKNGSTKETTTKCVDPFQNPLQNKEDIYSCGECKEAEEEETTLSNKPPSGDPNIEPLCGSSSVVPKRWDCIVKERPLITCKDLYFNVATKQYSNNFILEHRQTCCADAKPAAGECKVSPTDEHNDGTTIKGNEPVCHLCGGSKAFPSIPDKYISARYIGTYTCEQFFHRGLDKLIPGFMCAPLQMYAEKNCGCGG